MPAAARIERLTPEQEERLPLFREEWFRWGICTQRADRAKAEAAILAMRLEIKVSKRPIFVWCESPATCLLALHYLKSAQWREFCAKARASLRASLGDSLRDSLRASLRDSLRDSLGDSLGDSLRASLGASLWDSLGDSLRASLGVSLGSEWWGQHESYWIAFYLFCRDILGVKYEAQRSRQLDMWRDVAQSCCWWWCYENYVVVSERPTVVAMDARGRLHCENGPAVRFSDGWSVFSVHGVRVPPRVVDQPCPLTIKEIEQERNAEVRRVMIERYGPSKFLLDSGAHETHRDARGVLYQKDLPGDEPLVMVKVRNSTPEPDGSVKDYFLRVPPGVRSASEAVAWTFGKERAVDYQPQKET